MSCCLICICNMEQLLSLNKVKIGSILNFFESIIWTKQHIFNELFNKVFDYTIRRAFMGNVVVNALGMQPIQGTYPCWEREILNIKLLSNVILVFIEFFVKLFIYCCKSFFIFHVHGFHQWEVQCETNYSLKPVT